MGTSNKKSFLGKLIKLTESFPDLKEKEKIVQQINDLIDYLTQVKAALIQLPTEEDIAQVRTSLLEIESKLRMHRANVLVDNITSAGVSKKPVREFNELSGKEDLDRLSKLDVQELRNVVNNENVYPVKRLKSILHSLGVKTTTKMVRQELQNLVITKISNYKGYNSLRKSET